MCVLLVLSFHHISFTFSMFPLATFRCTWYSKFVAALPRAYGFVLCPFRSEAKSSLLSGWLWIKIIIFRNEESAHAMLYRGKKFNAGMSEALRKEHSSKFFHLRVEEKSFSNEKSNELHLKMSEKQIPSIFFFRLSTDWGRAPMKREKMFNLTLVTENREEYSKCTFRGHRSWYSWNMFQTLQVFKQFFACWMQLDVEIHEHFFRSIFIRELNTN